MKVDIRLYGRLLGEVTLDDDSILGLLVRGEFAQAGARIAALPDNDFAPEGLEAHEVSESRVRGDELTLDSDLRLVTVRGQRLRRPLSRMQARFLRALLVAGHLTRPEAEYALWDTHPPTNPGNLSHIVNGLRARLYEFDADTVIVTVSGYGYQLWGKR